MRKQEKKLASKILTAVRTRREKEMAVLKMQLKVILLVIKFFTLVAVMISSIGSKSLDWCKKVGVKFNDLFL